MAGAAKAGRAKRSGITKRRCTPPCYTDSVAVCVLCSSEFEGTESVCPRCAEARTGMPADLDLQVERLSPATFPMYSLILTGGLPIADLRDYAWYLMRPAFSRVPGVGRVEVQASDTREIEVVLDPAKLTAAELTVVDVSDALKAQNTVLPVGRFAESGAQSRHAR